MLKVSFRDPKQQDDVMNLVTEFQRSFLVFFRTESFCGKDRGRNGKAVVTTEWNDRDKIKKHSSHNFRHTCHFVPF